MRYLAVLALSPLLWLAAQAPAAETIMVEIDEWPVPWPDTRPRDPYVNDLQQVWFAGQRGDYVAYLDPKSNSFERFDLEPGAGPHNVIVDEDNLVWYAGNRAAHIGRLTPSSGRIDQYPMPNPKARDPHTLTFDQQENIWFTVQGGNFIGKLDTTTGEILLRPVPTDHALPYGIVVDRQNRPWFTEFGTHKLGMVDPGSLKIREYSLPRDNARPRRLGITPDGNVWYVDYAEGYLGRLNPETRAVKEWRTPAAASARPYGMAADDKGRIWFVETGPRPNRLVGFDPATESFFSITNIPSGGGSIRHMFYHQPTRTIWFGTDTNTIGRAHLP